MKRYRFPLERLARVRAAQLELAEASLAAANAAVASAEAQRAEALGRLQATSVFPAEAASGPTAYPQWLDRRRAAHRGLVLAGEQLDAARDHQYAELAAWQLARQEHEVLTRLGDRRFAEWQQAVAAEELAALDEFVTQRRVPPAP